MRQLYQVLTILFFICCSLKFNAQATITFSSLDGQDVTNSQVTIEATTASNIPLPHFYVTNNSGSAKNWKITRQVITQPNGWYNNLCWGQLCYGAFTSTIWESDFATINNTEYGELEIYVGAPTVGNAHYRYSVSTDGVNFVAYVDVFVNVTETTADVQELTTNELLLYPNPAQNTVNLKGFSDFSYNLAIYDYSGRQVMYQVNSKTRQIDVSSLAEGNYIFIIKNNETLLMSKHQIIIKTK